ncbi:MAG: hypothetical protein LBK43_02120, partial [Treponema sp.]|nr:hypothetical protein [Treponema sp.]
LSYYDAELFQWSYSMFGGLTLNFKNQSAITTYGIKDNMKDAFIHYEDTNQQYRSYRSKTIAGNILVWGGLATVLTGVYVPIFGDRQNNTYENNFKIGMGVMLGGLITEIIGAVILQSGQENIFNAVHSYNRHKINDYP